MAFAGFCAEKVCPRHSRVIGEQYKSCAPRFGFEAAKDLEAPTNQKRTGPELEAMA